MWAFIVGIFAGRGLRNAGAPDSVKQERYDARAARKEGRRGNPVLLLAVAAIFVAVLVAVALTSVPAAVIVGIVVLGIGLNVRKGVREAHESGAA